MKTLKQRIRAGQPLTGCFVMAPSPTIVEMCGYAGFDFVVLDLEHGPSGTESLENQVRAAEASGAGSLVRVPWASRWQVQQALDAGADGIVVPHVTSAEYAREVVHWAHYPPHGARGLAGTARAGRHGNVATGDHLANSLQKTTVVLQIEDREALPHVAEIASVDGVDALFIGPSDLSASLGHPGNADAPEVASAIDGIIRDAQGRVTVLAFARDAQDGERWRNGRGVPVLVLSTAYTFTQALRSLAADMVVR